MNNLYVEIEVPKNCKVNHNTTFGMYSTIWLYDSRDFISEKTFSRYVDLLKRINKGIGHIPLCKLESFHIKTFIKNLSLEGENKITHKRLSDKTILHHYRLISVILQQAAREKIVKYNCASKDYMRIPRVHNTKKIESLQINDLNLLYNYLRLESPKWATATEIMLNIGLRRGELCGLEWQDIDFTNKTVNIERTSLYTSDKGIYTSSPKTPSSIRKIIVSDVVLKIFIDYKKWYTEYYGMVDLNYRRLFIQNDGTPMHPDSVTDWLKKFSNKHSDMKRVNPHLLRHTYISLMVAMGVSIKEIATRVGHTQLSTTCQYTHTITLAEIEASKALDNLILESEKTYLTA